MSNFNDQNYYDEDIEKELETIWEQYVQLLRSRAYVDEAILSKSLVEFLARHKNARPELTDIMAEFFELEAKTVNSEQHRQKFFGILTRVMRFRHYN